MNKILFGLLFLAVAGIAVGGYFFPKTAVFGSPQGSTFTTAKFFGATANLAAPGANATSTSILNSSGNALYITGFRIGCNGVGTSRTAYTGAGLANWQVTIATSSTAAPGTLTGFADVASSFTLGTSTTNLVVASSTTQTATSSQAMYWPAGSYLTFSFNATNTAVCTVGADVLGS